MSTNDDRRRQATSGIGVQPREEPSIDRQAVRAELERVRADFQRLLASASPTDLRRPTLGTRWTNEELLFHMVFGYMIVRTLMPLLGVFARLPRGAGKAYARLLDTATGPFDAINYVGAVAGSRVYNHRRMGAKMDRTLTALQRRLERDSTASLGDGMDYPAHWDPFFHGWMTRADLYHYPTQHYDFHRAQLSLSDQD
jgi:hypothetical protein